MVKIIGVGLGRTGTTSIEEALSKLGSYKTYNMAGILSNNLFNPWLDHIQSGKTIPPNWDEILLGYEATIAWPVCFYYQELMILYPDAKFILTTRDAEPWAKSYLSNLKVLNGLRTLEFIPRVRGMIAVLDHIVLPKLGGKDATLEEVMAAFSRHTEQVKATIPPERLLIYQVQQGWEPLCTLLDVPIPEDIAFPHENTGESFSETIRKMIGL
jgi:hypothetical protein